MKKFEYKIVEIPVKSIWTGRIDTEDLTIRLNALGKEGWEALAPSSRDMYSSSKGSYIILKKEIN